jgi:hypothetical protein
MCAADAQPARGTGEFERCRPVENKGKTRFDLGDAAGMDKQFATLRARAALSGVELYQVDDDVGRPLFIVTKWAMTSAMSTLDDVAAWLARVDGKVE